ncbi:MAG: DUF488 domain-containing protein [Candidatus Saccharimonadales bacterium]
MNTIFTIGHSTRLIDEFIELLKLHSITQLVDMRTIPKSRHNPQFGQEEIAMSLKKARIEYVYLKELGGLRPPTKDSINDGWHSMSFRNYADYMQTEEFDGGLRELIGIAKDEVTAIMCAEAVPWRCHRSLVSDALIVRSIPISEIIGKGNVREHTLTPFAVVDGTTITYPKSALEVKEADD